MNTRHDDYLFGRRQTWWIFSLFCILMMFDFADRMVIAAVLPHIRDTWQLTDAQSGMLGSALFLCMVLFALPTSFFIDRWSRTKTAGLMGGIWCLASGAGAFVTSFPQLLFTRAIVGAGEAGYLPAGIAWLSAAFPRRRRQFALGILLSSQSVGTLLGLIAGALIATHFGWRHALGLLALPGLVVAILIYRSKDYPNVKFVPPAPDAPLVAGPDADLESGARSVPLRFEGFRIIARTPSLWLVYLALSMLCLNGIGMQYFMPTLFHRIHGVSLQNAAFISSAVLLTTAIAGPLGGWIMDRGSLFRPENKLTFAFCAFGVSTLLHVFTFGVVENLFPRFGLMLLSSFIAGMGITSILTVTQELVPQRYRALSSTCCITFAHLLGSVPGPWFAGRLSDAYGLIHAFLILGVACGLASAFFFLIARRFYTRDYARTHAYRQPFSANGAAA
ncbi:MAG: MFS transporter [Zoogloeaceae bacterium]|jgi:MFS family permease|nr:MFS transporter [Zoogloeaceae bacterium]